MIKLESFCDQFIKSWEFNNLPLLHEWSVWGGQLHFVQAYHISDSHSMFMHQYSTEYYSSHSFGNLTVKGIEKM